MRTFKPDIIPARETKKCSEVRCALCKKIAKFPHRAVDGNWADDYYTVDKVTITRETGASYPEGGNSVVTEIDICPECFDTKVRPAMRDLGALDDDFITEERDY